MAIAKGVAKKVAFKEESTFGVLPGATGGQRIRRVESTLSLNKDTYQSNEIRSDYQVADFRHGVRRVAGNLNGELSLGTYEWPLAAALRKDWAAGVSYSASSGDGLTVDNTAKTLTREGGGSGSFITDGFKIGDVVRCANLNGDIDGKNLRITALTATVMTVAEAPGADVAVADEDATITVPGKKLWVPTSGHLNKSGTFEHYFSDVDEVEVFTGCMVDTIELGLPPTGMSTINIGIMGKDMTSDPNGDGNAPYFTTPADETTTAVMAAVNGALRLGGKDVAVLTGLTINIANNLSGDPVVGSNTIPELFPGRVVVTGQMTAYYEGGGSLLADFINETELYMNAYMKAGQGDDSEFMAINIGRLKLGGNSKDDGEKGLVQTIPFTALLDAAGGTGTAKEKTTISIQDSTLS